MAAKAEKEGVKFALGLVAGGVLGYGLSKFLERTQPSRRPQHPRRPVVPSVEIPKEPSRADNRLTEAESTSEERQTAQLEKPKKDF